jgi:hypothetical protein
MSRRTDTKVGYIVMIVRVDELEPASKVFVLRESAVEFARLLRLTRPDARVIVEEVRGRRPVGPDLFEAAPPAEKEKS